LTIDFGDCSQQKCKLLGHGVHGQRTVLDLGAAEIFQFIDRFGHFFLLSENSVISVKKRPSATDSAFSAILHCNKESTDEQSTPGTSFSLP